MKQIRNNRGIFDSNVLGTTLAKLVSFVEGERYVYTVSTVEVMKTSQETDRLYPSEKNCMEYVWTKIIAKPEVCEKRLCIWLGGEPNANDFRQMQKRGEVIPLNMTSSKLYETKNLDCESYPLLPLVADDALADEETGMMLPDDERFSYISEFVDFVIERSVGIKKLSNQQMIKIVRDFVADNWDLILLKRDAKIKQMTDDYLYFADVVLWNELDPSTTRRRLKD